MEHYIGLHNVPPHINSMGDGGHRFSLAFDCPYCVTSGRGYHAMRWLRWGNSEKTGAPWIRFACPVCSIEIRYDINEA